MGGFDIEIDVPLPGVQTIKDVNEQLTKTVRLQADIKKGAAAPIIKGPYQALENARQAQAALPGNAPYAQQRDAELNLLRAVKKVQQAQAAMQPAQARATAIQGPYQKRAAAQQAMQNATTPEQYHDAALAAERAEKAIARSQPPTPKTFGQKLGTVISSSRYDLASGNLMPLVGRSLELLGPAGPWVMGLLAGVSALKAFGEAVSEAGSRALAFESNRLGAGGTVQEQATADVLGKSLNMSGKDITAIARQYADKLNTDPMAALMANDWGEFAQPPMNRRVDQLTPLFREMERQRNEPLDVATREARATGTDALMPYRELDDASRKIVADAILRHSAAQSDTSYGPNEKAKQAAIETGLSDVWDSVIKRMSGGKGPISTGNAESRNFMKDYAKVLALPITGIVGGIDLFGHGGGGGLMNPPNYNAPGGKALPTTAGGTLIPPLPGDSGKPGIVHPVSNVSPLDANTQAVQNAARATNANTMALDAHRKVISEGTLAAGAVPAAMRSMQPDAQVAYLQHIKTLGPFID